MGQKTLSFSVWDFFPSSSQFIYIQNPMNYNIPAEGDHQAGAIWSRELSG